jgi:hypothetical protein
MATSEAAQGKRLEIKQLRKQMFITVCAAAVLLGFSVVGVIYMTKLIIFNAKVLDAKAATVEIYKSNTEAIKSLNEKVLGLTDNESLEVVAKDRDPSCLTTDGKLADFNNDIDMTRKCSAIRVVPDAIPAVRPGNQPNATALGASLGELLNFPGIVREADHVGTVSTSTGAGLLNAIDTTFSVRADATAVKGLMEQMERSIRPFTVNTANFQWRAGGDLAVAVTTNSFFVNESTAERKYKDIKVEGSKK